MLHLCAATALAYSTAARAAPTPYESRYHQPHLTAARTTLGSRRTPTTTLRTHRLAMQAADVEDTREYEEWELEDETDDEDPSNLSNDAKKVYNNMRSSTGVEFAPWMKIDPEAIAKAEKERAARKARKAAASKVIDPMQLDPQAAELGAGGGLKSKTLSEEEVELRWSTGDETDNKGFVVQRRGGGSNNFEDIGSYDRESNLRSKGPSGGSYTFLDDTVPYPGTWVYRILDVNEQGQMSNICQKLVEVESQSEQMQTLAVGAVIALLAGALVAAGIFADPIQTTDMGRGGF